MSCLALRDEGLAVLDSLLSADRVVRLREAVSGLNFKSVHADGWNRSWSIGDGSPQRGDFLYYDPSGGRRSQGLLYPTGTPFDDLIDALVAAARKHPDVVGRENHDWDAIYLSPWVYPPGSALRPHCDDGPYSGSFTFFLHDQWELHWGGELIAYRMHPASEGLGHAIVPLPDRLALLGPNVFHRVARVDQTAGDHVRISIAGFFLRPM